jgi:hypothetical protein
LYWFPVSLFSLCCLQIMIKISVNDCKCWCMNDLHVVDLICPFWAQNNPKSLECNHFKSLILLDTPQTKIMSTLNTTFKNHFKNLYQWQQQLVLRHYVQFWPQALEFRTPPFPHLVPPAIMVWIFVWKYIVEPFIHILQHFVNFVNKYLLFVRIN